EAGESCDDGNQSDYDGCTRQCEFERALVIDGIQWLPESEGCDLTGDGVIDNAVGKALGATALQALSDYATRQILTCRHSDPLFYFVGTDPTMTTAPFRVAFLVGLDTDHPTNPANNFTGSQTFWTASLGLDTTGAPLGWLDGSAPGGRLQTTRGRVVYWS